MQEEIPAYTESINTESLHTSYQLPSWNRSLRQCLEAVFSKLKMSSSANKPINMDTDGDADPSSANQISARAVRFMSPESLDRKRRMDRHNQRMSR